MVKKERLVGFPMWSSTFTIFVLAYLMYKSVWAVPKIFLFGFVFSLYSFIGFIPLLGSCNLLLDSLQ